MDSGRSFDPEKVHCTDHKGEHFKVRGPLNLSRSSKGHPVIVPAGQSEDGRRLAAATAEVIFTAHQRLDTAQEFYRDIKARARGLGRNPDHVLIMPGVSPFVGQTGEEAREKHDRLTSLILEEHGIAPIKGLTGGTLDLTGVDLDGPPPPVSPTEGMKTRQALIRQIADENGATVRQLYQHVASARGHFTVVGTATQIADILEDWFQNEGDDGFNILPPWLPTGLTVRGVNQPEAETRARHCIRLVGLSDFETADPLQLSGGMAQRVGIARALTVQPEILLLDEPLRALEAMTKLTMQEDLARIWRDETVTLVLVTHDLEEAIYLSDRVLVMPKGSGNAPVLLDIGPSRPRERNEAQFVALRRQLMAQFGLQ